MKTLKQLKETVNPVLIQLADVDIIAIEEDGFSNSGCETCDYGSEYGIDYLFTFSDYEKHFFKVSDSYESPVSQGDMMRFLLSNLEEFKKMTRKEFIKFSSDPKNILGE